MGRARRSARAAGKWGFEGGTWGRRPEGGPLYRRTRGGGAFTKDVARR